MRIQVIPRHQSALNQPTSFWGCAAGLALIVGLRLGGGGRLTGGGTSSWAITCSGGHGVASTIKFEIV